VSDGLPLFLRIILILVLIRDSLLLLLLLFIILLLVIFLLLIISSIYFFLMLFFVDHVGGLIFPRHALLFLGLIWRFLVILIISLEYDLLLLELSNPSHLLGEGKGFFSAPWCWVLILTRCGILTLF
jgi:hypothetical protein